MSNNQQDIKIEFKDLSDYQKEILYRAMYDLHVEGIKEEIIYEDYKHDDIDRDLLFDAIYNPSDEMDQFFEEKYENEDNEQREVEMLLDKISLFTISQKKLILKELKKQISGHKNKKELDAQ